MVVGNAGIGSESEDAEDEEEEGELRTRRCGGESEVSRSGTSHVAVRGSAHWNSGLGAEGDEDRDESFARGGVRGLGGVAAEGADLGLSVLRGTLPAFTAAVFVAGGATGGAASLLLL